MKNYSGKTMVVRETNQGKFQVLPEHYTDNDMSRAQCFNSAQEAEAYINRPMPQYVANEQALQIERQKYVTRYAEILASTDLIKMRQNIQELYRSAAWESKKAGDAQRAAIRGNGKKSAMGRDIGEVRQTEADRQADGVSESWRLWGVACGEYELALQEQMVESGIPVKLFRSPVVINDRLICKRCDYTWTQRGVLEPKFCPNCNSPYWNKERRVLNDN